MANKLTAENYHSQEMNKQYMSYHTWASLHGTDGLIPCEARAIAEMNGEYVDESKDDTAFLIGGYVDAALTGEEGELEKYIEEHPEMISTRGESKGKLKATYVMADKMIERAKKDKLFMASIGGEHQKIFTGEIAGVPFKCKLDSYQKGKAITDLKTTRSIHDTFYVPDVGRVDFISYYGYIYQLAIYRELVYQNTGEMLPCYIAAISKSKDHPEIKVIEVDEMALFDAFTEVKRSLEYNSIADVWKGKIEPLRCENPKCPYCIDTEILTGIVNFRDLINE